MRPRWKYVIVGVLLIAGVVGCKSKPTPLAASSVVQPLSSATPVVQSVAFYDDIRQGSLGDNTNEQLPSLSNDDLELVSPEHLAVQPQGSLSLDNVALSIHNHFPLIQQAAAARGIASGEALSASGAFDHKLQGFSATQPLDFYENYRHSISVKRDTMWGGQTFAGYRIGRGSFEPWYLERETNRGGEFTAGFVAPIVRDRWIDANRAELWQAQLEQRRVEPEIMAQIIRFVRDGAVAYWNWVAAGENHRIAEGLLNLANERNEGLKEQVRAEEKARIDLVDNQRIIVSREAKLIDARRKLEQAAVKLSLFYRSEIGEPLVVNSMRLPDEFLQQTPQDETSALGTEAEDTSFALTQRPELAELQLVREQLCIALRQAKNETWPDVDGGVLVAQDVGEPTSPKRDKSEFELEALVTLSVPLERRKALGKVRSLRWKLAQLNAKNRFAADKIVADVRLARAALTAAIERVQIASEGYNLAVQMQEAEQELFNQGQSTLFNLNIREQQAAEAAVAQVQALFEYFVARADYTAAMGYDTPAL
ncbi:MAG: TolC family protein [Pirellulales bacterium]|nr:TolC family protein [Pirellulales bacterium]